MKRRLYFQAAAITAGISVTRGAQASGSDLIRVALVGCGGRGTGAIKQRLEVGDNVKLVAIADASANRARLAYESMMAMKNTLGDKIALKKDAVFDGFGAYKQAIDSCDQVLLATPPCFRPIHYKYAVEKGKHVFMEKPCCVDAPGYRSLMETNKLADEKGLVVVVGLQRHYDPKYIEFLKRIQDGILGDLMYARIYWNGGGVWERPRQPGDNELMAQMRNWYNINWLTGDSICEQHVHNIDVANWFFGNGDPLWHPVKVVSMGGRAVRNFPRFKNSGYRFDNFTSEFTYPDGRQIFSQCKHHVNTWALVSEQLHGTKGYGTPDSKGKGWIAERKTDKPLWKFEGKSINPYQAEHNAQVEFIRKGEKHNDGWYGATSTFTAIFARMAAMSGQELTWDEAAAKGRWEYPPEGINSWDQNPPVMPDKGPRPTPAPGEIIYENSVPVPGVWRWDK